MDDTKVTTSRHSKTDTYTRSQTLWSYAQEPHGSRTDEVPVLRRLVEKAQSLNHKTFIDNFSQKEK